MDADFGSLAEVLTWVVAGGGAMVLAGYVVAYLAENIPTWHTLPRWLKVIIPIALAALFGFVAQSVLSLGLMDVVPPTYQALILMLINWLASQKAYLGIKDSSYGLSARSDGGPSG